MQVGAVPSGRYPGLHTSGDCCLRGEPSIVLSSRSRFFWIRRALITAVEMGQRHQIFAIARVDRRYRTLAALHSQWSYGKGPLERCLRLLLTFPAQPNRVPLLRELRAARETKDELW